MTPKKKILWTDLGDFLKSVNGSISECICCCIPGLKPPICTNTEKEKKLCDKCIERWLNDEQ